MKFLLTSCIILACVNGLIGQQIAPASIEDSVLGWMKVYNYKGAKAPMKVDGRTYSVAQLSICDSFVNWMQASYVPKGGLGDVIRTVAAKIGLYNQNDAALPQSYGAYAKTYTELKYNASHKMVPLTNSHVEWSIMANGMPGYAADIFCTPSAYYFMLPSFGEQGYDDEFPKPYGLATHPNTKNYFTYFKRNSMIGNEKTVILFRDNRMPFIQLTRGEYLQLVEATIMREYEKEKKKIYEKEQGNQRSIDYFMKYLDDKQAKRKECLQKNKEKYRDRLQEPATIFTLQPDIMLENYCDVFEGNGGSHLKLPVYRVDPKVQDLCRLDQPQWIRITWHGDIFDPVGKHQHESIINNFNFDYVYNFFFAPQKVKGQPYRPLRPALYREEVKTAEASNESKRMALDKNIHYFEDFSSSVPGQKPNGWQSKLAFEGTYSVVRKVEGLEGNWAEMTGNYYLRPLKLKPLPQDFTLVFDLVAAQHYTWGAKGLTLELGKETSPGNVESYIKLRFRPGFDGREGEVMCEVSMPSPPGYMNASKWATAPGFSNDKTINRVSVTIVKKGERLQVFVDQHKIAEYEKAIPAALSFNAMSFYISGTTGANDKMFIGNIRISSNQ